MITLAPGSVKAVLGIESECSGICQKPEVRSSVEKMVDSDRPIMGKTTIFSTKENIPIALDETKEKQNQRKL